MLSCCEETAKGRLADPRRGKSVVSHIICGEIVVLVSDKASLLFWAVFILASDNKDLQLFELQWEKQSLLALTDNYSRNDGRENCDTYQRLGSSCYNR